MKSLVTRISILFLFSLSALACNVPLNVFIQAQDRCNTYAMIEEDSLKYKRYNGSHGHGCCSPTTS